MAQPRPRLKVPATPSAGETGARPPRARPVSAVSAGPGHFLAQFEAPPAADVLAALAARGARVLQDIPDNTVLAVAGYAVDLSGLGVVWAGPIEARQKISPLIAGASAEASAADATRPQGSRAAAGGVYLVEFHPDVNLNDGRRIVLNSGFTLRENPDLGPQRLMVEGTGSFDALSAADEVAYIFPASAALAAGLPVDRCYSGLTANGGVAQLVATYGSGWDGDGLNAASLTYSWGADTSKLTPSAARAEIERAMAKWSEVAALDWQQGTVSAAVRNVHILFAEGDHSDGYPFNGPGGVLAHTFYPSPPNPESIAGDMHFDDAETWNIGAHIDLFSVALHELGHALGLGHSDDPNAVMYPYYSLVNDLTAEDRSAILTLYAPAASEPPPPPAPAPPPQPSVVAAAPNSASGSGATFTFEFADANDPANLTGMAMLFSSSPLALSNACYIVYDRVAQNIALVWDNGNGSNRKPLGSAATLANSACSVGAVSAQTSGLSLILTVPVTFKAAFSGVRNIYMFGVGGTAKTGWAQRGTYTVVASGVVVAQPASPASGSGFAQTFQFTVSDAGGSGNITGIAVLFAPALNPVNACLLVYDRARGTIAVSYDSAAGSSPVAPGSFTVVANSQCGLRAANSAVTIGATSIVLTLDLTFQAGFAGQKNVYLYGAEAASNSGWATVGQWTVPGGVATADGMSPSSGTGAWPSFAFTVSDSVSQGNLTGAEALFTTGGPSNLANACHVVYNRGARTIGLYDDAGTAFSSKTLGASSPLQNSQCAVGYAVMHTSGNSIVVTVYFYLKPAFAGAKTVYLRAMQASGGSAWTAVGDWTAP